MNRFRVILNELPGAFLLSVLTAVVTLLLAILLSAVLGGENEAHRLATRCYNAEIIDLLREVISESSLADKVDLTQYPAVNTEGIDCSFFEVPISDTEVVE